MFFLSLLPRKCRTQCQNSNAIELVVCRAQPQTGYLWPGAHVYTASSHQRLRRLGVSLRWNLRAPARSCWRQFRRIIQQSFRFLPHLVRTRGRHEHGLRTHHCASAHGDFPVCNQDLVDKQIRSQVYAQQRDGSKRNRHRAPKHVDHQLRSHEADHPAIAGNRQARQNRDWLPPRICRELHFCLDSHVSAFAVAAAPRAPR
mmetsp:Transcript_9067/g.23864  ORF Transcript_9067/g.23864 Transcript_9067/m.23864 type:complete len:201 (-) Transcript_9067:872-1474(-)